MKLPRGIERTPDGFRCFVQYKRIRRRKRFPHGTDPRDMKTWRERTKAKLQLGLEEKARSAPSPGFRTDATAYLETVKGMRSYRDRKRDIGLWAQVFGDRPRAEIEPPEIGAQLERWRADGLAASTLNHRRAALMHMFRVLDAHTNAPNPVDKVKHYREPEPEPRALPYDVVRA